MTPAPRAASAWSAPGASPSCTSTRWPPCPASRSRCWPTCARRRRGHGLPGTASAVGDVDGRAPAPRRSTSCTPASPTSRTPRSPRRCSAAGRHVMAEKPLAMDEASARRPGNARRGRGRRQRLRLLHPPPPAGRAAAARRRRGRERRRPPRARRLPAGLAAAARRSGTGGSTARCPGASATLADLGGHFLDLVEHVTGRRVVSIQASTGRLHDERDVGDPPVARARGARGPRRAAGAASTAGRWSARTLSQVSAGWRDRLFLELSLGDRTLAWSYEDAGDVRRRAAGRTASPRRRGAATTRLHGFFSFLPDVYTRHPGRRARGPAGDVRDGLHSVELMDAALGAPPRAAGSTSPRRSCSRSPRPGSPVLVLRGPLALGIRSNAPICGRLRVRRPRGAGTSDS